MAEAQAEAQAPTGRAVETASRVTSGSAAPSSQPAGPIRVHTMVRADLDWRGCAQVERTIRLEVTAGPVDVSTLKLPFVIGAPDVIVKAIRDDRGGTPDYEPVGQDGHTLVNVWPGPRTLERGNYRMVVSYEHDGFCYVPGGSLLFGTREVAYRPTSPLLAARETLVYRILLPSRQEWKRRLLGWLDREELLKGYDEKGCEAGRTWIEWRLNLDAGAPARELVFHYSLHRLGWLVALVSAAAGALGGQVVKVVIERFAPPVLEAALRAVLQSAPTPAP
jgi:hypothetical protein